MSSDDRTRVSVDDLRKARHLSEQTEHLARLGHWEWDLVEDKLLYCSPELARLHGLSVEEYMRRVTSLAGRGESVVGLATGSCEGGDGNPIVDEERRSIRAQSPVARRVTASWGQMQGGLTQAMP